ncbi:MAG: alpha/beta hydrolase [Pseudomonadales bacterium]|nr:alpha/beta hydrolase [Pseudomonadales bacterium]MCP5186082.1 alpha/beta hydrolase [Pseudomonadales bacterium]
MLEPRASSHYYFSQRLRLHYLDWGNASAPPMLLVHGVQDHCHTWDYFAREFQADFHIVAPDLRGHGDSDWHRGGAYRHADYVYDLVRLLKQRDLAGCVVVAHSMGATVAAMLAGGFPELITGLVLIEGVGLWPGWYQGMSVREKVRAWESQTLALADRSPRRYPSLEAACKRMRQVNPQLTEAVARHLTIHGSHQNEDGTFSWKFDNYTHGPSLYGIPPEDTVAFWQAVECPTLILNAAQGYPHRIGHEGTEAHFRRHTMLNIDEAGHWLHHDQHGRVVDEVALFAANLRLVTDPESSNKESTV